MDDEDILLEGKMTIEGPFLEKLWAAFQISKFRRVVPRYETLGTHHDLLVTNTENSTVYECTGQAEMTEKKIHKFVNDVQQLQDRLEKAGEPPLKEAILVSTTLRSGWANGVKQTFERAKRQMEETYQINLNKLEDYDVLYELIFSGVLGLRLIDNRIIFAGPEDYCLRYDSGKNSFIKGFANINLNRFRELPHSFLPSHYWEQRYRELFEEAMKPQLEWVREPPWVYTSQYGIKWAKPSDVKKLYQTKYEKWPRVYTLLSEDHGFIQDWRSRRRHDYYSVHVFDCSEIVTRDKVSEQKGYTIDLFWKLKEANEYLKSEKAGLHLYFTSGSFSPLAWAESKESTAKEISIHEVKQGEDMLRDLLNDGFLGFSFTEQNLITLASPPIKSIRWTPQGLEKPKMDESP